MKKIFLTVGCSFFLVMAVHAECPIGYRPSTAAFLATEKDLSRMELSENDRSAAQEKIASFSLQEEELRAEFHEKAMLMTTALSGRLPNRQDVDALSDRLADIIKELNALRVGYSLDMAERLKAENIRRVKSRPAAYDSVCEGSVTFPPYRYELSSKERELIGVTEDERRYLKDFDAREAYFRGEQRDLRQKLDFLLSSKDVDRISVDETLRQLAVSVRERATNRLDRYFYADKVIFAPDREKKLLSYREAKDRRSTKIKTVRKAKPVKKAVIRKPKAPSQPKTKKKWYWPF